MHLYELVLLGNSWSFYAGVTIICTSYVCMHLLDNMCGCLRKDTTSAHPMPTATLQLSFLRNQPNLSVPIRLIPHLRSSHPTGQWAIRGCYSVWNT